MWIGCGHPVLTNFFYSYGRMIARHPHAVLFFSLGVFVFFLYGLFDFRRINDLEELFSPMNAPSKRERKRFNDMFPEDAQHRHSPLRTTAFGKFFTLVVTTTDGNVLSPDVIADVRRLDNAVHAVRTTKYNSDSSTKTYTYKDVCARDMGQCLPDPVLLILQFDQPSQIRFPFHQINFSSGVKIDVFLGYSLGGVSVEGGNTSAKAWKLQYALQPAHLMNMQWQLDALAAVKQLKFPHISVSRFAARSVQDELHEVSKQVSPLFVVSFSLLVGFSVVSLLSSDWLEAKPQLAIAGVVSSCLAIPSAFGLCSQLGIPGADIIAASPFLIIGIGIDDTYVMVAAWRQTDHRMMVEERMGHAFAHAAVAVTITSLTDVLCIAVGAFTQFRSVQIFCAFTGAGIIFDFFYQLTFLGACMVFTGRREVQCKHPMACTTVIPLSEAGDRSTLFRWFCTGGSVGDDKRPTSWTVSFFRDTWVDLLNHGLVKVFVVALYAAYMTIAVCGCTRLREGLHLSQLALDGSYVNDFYDINDRYFCDLNLPVGVLIEGRIVPWKKEDWQYMEEILQSYERDSEFFHGANLSVAWTRRFEKQFGTFTDRHNFTRALSAFLGRLENKLYNLDVKWNYNKTALMATRFQVISKNLDNSTRETAMMQRARRIAADTVKKGFTVTAFQPLFIFFDKYAIVVPTTLRNLVLATFAMFVVSLLLIPCPACSVSVTLSIASICTGVIGYMTWWGVNMDSITMVNIIMCIGFSVDYSAHITNAFVTASGEGKVERMRNALAMVGYPIAQSAASTILAISILTVARGYMLRAFFKIMFLVIIFGMFHGLLVIPEILLAVGGGVVTYERYIMRNRVDQNFPICFNDNKLTPQPLVPVNEFGDSQDYEDMMTHKK